MFSKSSCQILILKIWDKNITSHEANIREWFTSAPKFHIKEASLNVEPGEQFQRIKENQSRPVYCPLSVRPSRIINFNMHTVGTSLLKRIWVSLLLFRLFTVIDVHLGLGFIIFDNDKIVKCWGMYTVMDGTLHDSEQGWWKHSPELRRVYAKSVRTLLHLKKKKKKFGRRQEKGSISLQQNFQ